MKLYCTLTVVAFTIITHAQTELDVSTELRKLRTSAIEHFQIKKFDDEVRIESMHNNSVSVLISREVMVGLDNRTFKLNFFSNKSLSDRRNKRAVVAGRKFENTEQWSTIARNYCKFLRSDLQLTFSRLRELEPCDKLPVVMGDHTNVIELWYTSQRNGQKAGKVVIDIDRGTGELLKFYIIPQG